MLLRLRPEARLNLEAAARWYEAQEPGLGRRFLQEVRQAFHPSEATQRPMPRAIETPAVH